jgi:hypothetical protein
VLKAIYLDKARVVISADKWKALRADESYRRIRAFDNGKLRALATWEGKVLLKKGQTIADAAIYALEVHNILSTDAFGNPLDRPQVVRDVAASGIYRTEEALVAVYEDLLVRFAGCEWVPSDTTPGGSRLIEKGNVYAPIDKGTPAYEEGLDMTRYGSW